MRQRSILIMAGGSFRASVKHTVAVNNTYMRWIRNYTFYRYTRSHATSPDLDGHLLQGERTHYHKADDVQAIYGSFCRKANPRKLLSLVSLLKTGP